MRRELVLGGAIGALGLLGAVWLLAPGSTEVDGEEVPVARPSRRPAPVAAAPLPSSGLRVGEGGLAPATPVPPPQPRRFAPSSPRPTPSRDFGHADALIDAVVSGPDAPRTPAEWGRAAEELRVQFDVLDDLDCQDKEPQVSTMVALALEAAHAADRSGVRSPESFKQAEIGEVSWYRWMAAGFIVEHELASEPDEALDAYIDAIRGGRAAPSRLCAPHFAIGEGQEP